MEKRSIKEAMEFNEDRFSKVDVFKTKNSTLFMLNFLPNQQMPAHNHPGYELYLHVTKGSGTFTIDGNDAEVEKDDVVHVAGDEQLSFRNTGENPVSIYVTMSRVKE